MSLSLFKPLKACALESKSDQQKNHILWKNSKTFHNLQNSFLVSLTASTFGLPLNVICSYVVFMWFVF